MSATPIHDAAFVAATIDHLFAPLRLAVGLDQPAPKPRTPRKPRRQSKTRLAILHASPLLYAVSAA